MVHMDSINPECNPLKHEYDACFNKWYAEKFLKGLWTGEEGNVPCAELFHKYQACVKKTLNEKNININDVLDKIIGTSDEKQPPTDTSCHVKIDEENTV